jgi:hypothetical protein
VVVREAWDAWHRGDLDTLFATRSGGRTSPLARVLRGAHAARRRQTFARWADRQ